MLFIPKQNVDISSIPSISLSGEFHIITSEEHHHTTLENAAKSKLNGLRRKSSKQ